MNLRFKIFNFLMVRFSAWARRRRAQVMVKALRLQPGQTVLDVGGNPSIWSNPELPPLKVTMVNNDVHELAGTIHQTVIADGCSVPLRSKSFDIAFSNSVIEHVGDISRRQAFAAEIRRLGTAYWVQTPSIWFPIEAHCGMPGWFFYPRMARNAIVAHWKRTLPDWASMVEGTTVISKRELRKLFPDARILIERVAGIPKSYIAVKTKGYP